MSSFNEIVSSYMAKQNRPYSVQNVFDNLHGQIPKAKLIAVLDDLVESKVLISKSYGAQKFYCATQDVISREELDVQKAKILEDTRSVEVTLTELSSEVSRLLSKQDQKRKIQQLQTRKAQLEAAVAKAKADLDHLSSASGAVTSSAIDPTEANRLEAECDLLVKRRDSCTKLFSRALKATAGVFEMSVKEAKTLIGLDDS